MYSIYAILNPMHEDLFVFKSFHLSGIGGIGMSALARLLLNEGKTVSGSDRSPSKITEALSLEGVKVFSEETGDNLDGTCDVLIHTPAVSEEHPELKKARELKIPTVSYPEALGIVSKNMFTVAVSGTHGKTTTTAMIAHILRSTGHLPTVVVGSLLCAGGKGSKESNFFAGDGSCFVVEACEYKRSFSHLHPDILVITNIDEDHLDYYKDISDIQSAFVEVALKVPRDGTLVCSAKDELLRPVVGASISEVVDYKELSKTELHIPVNGEHNRLNAMAAISVARCFGVSVDSAVKALETFPGTWRRFEYKGETRKGSLVYDDYAHHPSEIKATISAAKESFPDSNIITVFQPHLYSRTEAFFDDIVGSLSLSDRTVLLPVYQARSEKAPVSRTSSDISESLRKQGFESFYSPSFEEATELTFDLSESGDVIIMMGAGDIYTATEMVLEI